MFIEGESLADEFDARTESGAQEKDHRCCGTEVYVFKSGRYGVTASYHLFHVCLFFLLLTRPWRVDSDHATEQELLTLQDDYLKQLQEVGQQQIEHFNAQDTNDLIKDILQREGTQQAAEPVRPTHTPETESTKLTRLTKHPSDIDSQTPK